MPNALIDGALIGAPFHSLLDLVKVSSKPQLALGPEVITTLAFDQFIPPTEPLPANTNFTWQRYYAMLTGSPLAVTADTTLDLPCPPSQSWLVRRAHIDHHRTAGAATGQSRIQLVTGGVVCTIAADLGNAPVQGALLAENIWVPPGVTLRLFFDYTGNAVDTQLLTIGLEIYGYPPGWAGRS